MRVLSLVLLVGCIAAGCATAPKNVSFFEGAEEELAHATRSIGAHLVRVIRTRMERSEVIGRGEGSSAFRSENRSRVEAYVGIVVGPDGHILVPFQADKEDMKDIRVWVEREEFRAEFVAYEKTLEMSILRIVGTSPFAPLAFAAQLEPRIGQWLAALNLTGEEADYVPGKGLFMVAGRRAARFPEIRVDGIGGLQAGAPLLDRQGVPVAIVAVSGGARVLSASFAGELDRFVKESLSGVTPDPDEKSATLGACVHPVIKEHATLLGLPESALWIAHVLSDSAASAAGMQAGDLIVGVDGEPLRLTGGRVRDEFNWRLSPKPGKAFSITIRRGEETVVCAGTFTAQPDPVTFESKELGVTVREIDDNLFIHRNLAVREGVMVADVLAGGAASTSSRIGRTLLQKGDVIVALGGVPTPDVRALSEVVERIRETKPHAVLVEYWRGRVSGYAAINVTIGNTGNGGAQP